MRLIAFPLCIFLNVMLFGMCGYIYLLWLQYWHHLWAQKNQEQPEYEMSDFRKNEMVIEYYDEESIQLNAAHLQAGDTRKSPLMYFHKDMYPGKVTDVRLQMFKTKTLAKLHQTLINENNNVDPSIDNRYGVTSKNLTSNHTNLLCDLYSKVGIVRTIQKSDTNESVREVLPNSELLSGSTKFNTCAIVSSAGSLHGSNLGGYIDSNDFVLRFNNAPVQGYEKDVGSKTSIRILNSQILSNMRFHFFNSSLYENVDLLVWDPSNYTSTLQDWIRNTEYNFLEPYTKYRKKYPGSNFHILDPSILWLIWDFIQSHTSVKIRKNPPSSGFLGIVLLLPYCSIVNVLEYIPTRRTTQRCHYYSEESDPLCTYGVWHPLAAEKIIAFSMNNASDETAFYNGYISIPGYSSLSC